MLFLSSNTDDEHRWALGAYGVSKAALNRLVDGLRAEHPDVRFTRATLGPTLTVGFAAEWDADRLNDAFARWVKEGQGRNVMSVEGVAQVLLTLITTLLEHPDVTMPVVHLTRAPAARSRRNEHRESCLFRQYYRGQAVALPASWPSVSSTSPRIGPGPSLGSTRRVPRPTRATRSRCTPHATDGRTDRTGTSASRSRASSCSSSSSGRRTWRAHELLGRVGHDESECG